MARIGVFVCWCGANIAETVDVERVARYAADLPGVVTACSYKYMCSDPGQRLITDAIREHRLSGVVVASCSPRMHEATFRKTAAAAGLNPYTVEVANIREHCSWVHNDREEATQKAEDLVRLAVERVKHNVPLQEIEVGVTRRVMVIGAGIAGIQAALDIAAAGGEVVLVEREPAIGGHMAQLDETFPTLDCSQCILTPRMVEIAHHDRITLYTYSEIEEVDGYVGNFVVKVRKKARSVDAARCTGCGRCSEKCPTKVSSEFDLGLRTRKAIYIPFPQAVPNVPVIDKENCRYYRTGKCRVCEKVCEAGAIAFDQQDEIVTEKVGAIVVATGYGVLDPSVFEEYGFGKYPDVVTSAQFERMASASGPTNGELRRPSNGEPPKSIVFLQCIGSREEEPPGKPYCSKICCMYTAKHTILYKHKVPDGQAFVFYMDVRAGGKNYEEFVRRVAKEKTATYLRGRVSKVFPRGDKLIVRGADTLSGAQVEIAAEMVVLAAALVPSAGVRELAQKLRISHDQHGFLSEAHPKLRPVETSTAGIFLAGACHGPKDIPESVAQASASASKALGIVSHDHLTREPSIGVVNELTCNGCFECENVCAYRAIERKELRDRKGNLTAVVAHINASMCQGCGACAVTCRSKSIEVQGFRDDQLFAAINAISR